MELAIKTENLSKTYSRTGLWRNRRKKQETTAVSDVSLSVPKGELFGLLGPNGAGKTTQVKILCILILPSSGSATVAGIDLKRERAIRAVTGLVVSDERSFYWRLSVQRILEFFAALHGLYGHAVSQRVKSVLEVVNLGDRRDQRFSDLSSGMRQRLAIARALLHVPKILILDEPTRSGLYVVQYPGGDVLATWYARDGWEDSGWISNLELGRETVWVEVLYYPGPNTAPTTMRILNLAPGTAYGWVSQGMGHALEVAWPDQPLMYEEAPDFSDRGL
jgi:ABC-type Na+ transport system ATPase subunit NatA